MFTTATRNTTSAKSSNTSLFQKDKANNAFIQPKLNIGKPGDKYEIEADRVADTVVAKGNDQSSSFFSPVPQVQKQQEEDVQKQELTDNEVQQKSLGDTVTPLVQRQSEEEIQSRELPENQIQPKAEGTNVVTELQKQEEEIQEKEEEEEDVQLVQLKSQAASVTDSSIESRLHSSKGSGAPLPKDTKTQMESGFGRDFSNVRVHTDSNAKQMSQDLGAQAFTHGNDIYFNEGKFDTSSNSGKHLLAHELTHTVQQGASTVRKKPVEVTSAPKMVQGSFLDWIPDWILDNARNLPGYLLFTVIIQYDPLRGERVEPTPTNLLRGLIGLVPFGVAIFDKLQEYAIIQRVFDWVTGKLSELNLTTRALLDLVEETWENNSATSFIGALREEFNDLVDRVTTFASSLVDQIIDWIKEALIDVAEPILAENRAWSLIKKIIHYDPLRDEEVTATTVEILEDFLMLIGKETELEQMRERGTLQETADWLDTQVGTFMSLLGELRGLINAAWEAIRPANLTEISANLTALSGRVTGFLERVWAFASTVAIEVLKLIKKALLSWLSSVANETRGFSLVKVIIGKDPFTDEHVPRTVPNLIRGFMSLMEGGEAQYAQMVETGAIARIVGEIQAAVDTLNMTPQYIVQLFTDLWNSFTIDDLLNPIDAFVRIIERFGEPIGRLIAFVAEIVRIVIVGILEIMNFPFDLIGNIITRSLQAIEDIKRDPIGFLKNILRAIKEGFVKFFDNIVTHLINGVMGWLMRELRDAGIPELTDFSLQGVISWVLEVLGLSMERIWEKLAEHPRIGPERVARIRGAINTLEGIWTFIKDVQERGIAAIWDKIQEQLSNLWNVVIDAVKNFVMTRIITQVTTRLLSMLDPTGIMAVVNGAIAFFNAVQSFIQYLREMLEVINSFVNGVADIARGNVATAADYLERTMGQSMPVVIGFLANQVGLGGIGARIAEIIGSVRALIDEALTWLVNKAVDTGMALLDRVMRRQGDDDLVLVKQNLHQEERAYLTNGAINNEEAQTVAQNVANRNSNLVSSIEVIDGQDTWDYNIIQRTEEEGPRKEEIVIEEDVILEVIYEGGRIRLNFIDQETTAVISPEVSDRRLLQVLQELEMEDYQAGLFYNELRSRNIINTDSFRQLLIAHARPSSAGQDPVTFLTNKLTMNESTAAAWSSPQSNTMRNRGVNLGTDQDGNQRETLSRFAQIFYEKEVGDWQSRPLERDHGPGEPRILEYIYQKQGNPQVISLGVVELNDNGEIVQIIEVNSNNIRGGRSGLIQLLERKGWRMNLS
ncbi:eCIS core domain-containing protein [Aquimarina sp. 433]